jgi:dTDP-4-dehydrorhamnose reductase
MSHHTLPARHNERQTCSRCVGAKRESFAHSSAKCGYLRPWDKINIDSAALGPCRCIAGVRLTRSTILVFGAGGQLGRELSKDASGEFTIRGVTRGDADITDEEAVHRAIDLAAPYLVVNAAAYTHVDRAETEVGKAFDANANGPGVIARACRGAGVPLIHISTDYVFDGNKQTAYTESDPIAPLGAYGRSKAAGEMAVREALDRHVILRTSWLYGIHGQNFAKTIVRLAAERDELRIVQDQRGCPTGSSDVAGAILAIARRLAAAAVPWGTYHFAGVGAATWYEFACEIVKVQAEFTHRHPTVTPIATAQFSATAKRPANSELDCARFAATFGLRALAWRARTRQVVTELLGNTPAAACGALRSAAGHLVP